MKKISTIIYSIICIVFGFLVVPEGVQAQISQNSFCVTTEVCSEDLRKDCNGQNGADICPAGDRVRIIFSEGHGCPNGQGRCLVQNDEIDLQVPIPTPGGVDGSVRGIDDYISLLFTFLLGASLVVAAAMIALGGYTYLTAAGNQAMISRAKEFILNAIIALFLLFGSVVFLNFFNTRTTSENPLLVDYVVQVSDKLRDCTPGANSPSPEHPCGQVTDDGNGACRGRYCPDNDICLAYHVSDLNKINTYRCTDPDDLPDACADAPVFGCEEVNAAIKEAATRSENPILKYVGKGCAPRTNSCAYGTLVECASGWEETRCSNCEPFRESNVATNFSTGRGDTGGTFDITVCSDTYNVKSTQIMLGSRTTGVVCCVSSDGKTYQVQQ